MRDTLKILLRNYNIDHLSFLTTNGISQFLDTSVEGFLQMEGGDVAIYDFANQHRVLQELDGDLVLTTPSWSFPYVFSMMAKDPKVSCVVCAGLGPVDGCMLNTPAIDTLTTYCSLTFGLEIDVEKQKEVTNILLEANDEIIAEDARMLKRVIDSNKKNEDIGGMFG